MLRPIEEILNWIRGEQDQDAQNRRLHVTDGELAVLKRFYESDAWTVINRMVDRAATLENERFINDGEDPEHARGYIRGVRAIPKAITAIITQEESHERRRSEQRERERRERRRTRDVATYGHPARESEQRRRARSE